MHIKEDFRRDRREGIRDRGCATGRQSESKIELLYPHRSVGWLVGWSDDRHLAQIVAMIFQPPLSRFVPSPSAILSPGRGVQQAWLLASLFPSCLSLAPSHLLLWLPSAVLLLPSSRGRATDGERARKELRLR